MDGVFGWPFDVLAGFDKPFNQAPSLHIALLVVLWVCYQRYTQGALRWLVHGWFVLIGFSVLNTYQHHFIDLPTGVLAGWLCVWLWPLDRPSPLQTARLAADRKRWALTLSYTLAAVFAGVPAFAFGGWWLWLLWSAVALLMVALNYALFDATGFQKGADGQLDPAVRWLLSPYLGAAWINSRLWTTKYPQASRAVDNSWPELENNQFQKYPQADLVVDNVWLGRIPDSSELQDSQFRADQRLWVMVVGIGVAFRLGTSAVILLFYAVSFYALREFLTLTPTRRSDYPALVAAFYLALPLQYLLIYFDWYGLFSIFIPVYVFLLLPILASLGGDTTHFLERASKVQWGLMIAVFCVSFVPALLTLDIPRLRRSQPAADCLYGDGGAAVGCVAVRLRQAAGQTQDRAESLAIENCRRFCRRYRAGLADRRCAVVDHSVQSLAVIPHRLVDQPCWDLPAVSSCRRSSATAA